jgi:hypothetical protein
VLAVTHTQPKDANLAIEISAAVKRRLGLDEQRSWIVISEANEFAWPGPDLRPVPGSPEGDIAYGFLPPSLFKIVQAKFVAALVAKQVRRVPRTE